MSDSSDDKPKVSLDTADLKARLGLKRRVKSTTDAGESASVEEARRKAEAEHAQAGAAEEEFSFMGQDKTPAPQPLPEKEVQGYIDFEGSKKSMMVPLIVGLTILAGLAFMLGNIFGTASQENETRDAFIEEARTKYATIAQVKPKGSDQTTLERWLSMSESLSRLNGFLQSMTTSYGLSNPYEQIESLVQDTEQEVRVGVLVDKFMALKRDLDAMKRDKVFYSSANLLGKSVQNPVTMAKVTDFAAKTEAFQVSLEEELARLRKLDAKYAAARVELFKRGVEAEFKDKFIFLKKGSDPVLLDSWTLLVPDATATKACSDEDSKRRAEACGACCLKQLGDRFQEERLVARKSCECLVDSQPQKHCRKADAEKGLNELPCPNGYTCQDDGKCATRVPGTEGQIVSLYTEKPPTFARNAKGSRNWVRYKNKTQYIPNQYFAVVDWAGVAGQARTAYAAEVDRDMKQIALNALYNLATKAKAAKWYGSGGAREALSEWACKTGTADTGEPDALFGCEDPEGKKASALLKEEREKAKKDFEKAVTDAISAEEAKAESEAAQKKKEAEEAKKKEAEAKTAPAPSK